MYDKAGERSDKGLITDGNLREMRKNICANVEK